MTLRWSGHDLRKQLNHPVLDADGHLLEITEAAYPYLREHLSVKQFQSFIDNGSPLAEGLAHRSAAERRKTRSPQSAWWGQHTRNVRDRATAMLPGLLYERLPEIGIDYAILYTTSAMGFLAIQDPELRRGLCAGWNEFLAELNQPYLDRMAFSGLIPMHTPEEAMAEMQHCADLGLKLIALPEGVLRPIPSPATKNPSPFLWPGQADWFDTFGLDSEHDYDVVWATAKALGFPVTFHGGLGLKPGVWTSVTNYSHNHIGVFAQLMTAVCKSLYFNGATRRFAGHPFVFLECGVSWGSQMLSDIVEHWHKRRVEKLDAYDPANLDISELKRYFANYGKDLELLLEGRDLDELLDVLRCPSAPDEIDDWAALDAKDEREVITAFVDSFYFGCEADDRGIASAFAASNPQRAQLKPIFSSDIGHWDVENIEELLEESMKLLEQDIVTPEQYKAFVFDNAAEMLRRANPTFFDKTSVTTL